MKRLIILISALFMFVSCYDDSDLRNRLEALEKMNYQSQIDALDKSVKSLEDADKEIKETISGLEGFDGNSLLKILEELELMDEFILDQLEELGLFDENIEKTLEELKMLLEGMEGNEDVTDWLSSTFATLEQYNGLVNQLKALNDLMEGQLELLEQADAAANDRIDKSDSLFNAELAGLKYADSVAKTELANLTALVTSKYDSLSSQLSYTKTEIEGWVTSTLEAYYTSDEVKAEIKKSLEEFYTAEEIDALMSEMKAGLDDMSSKIKSLDSRISTLEDKVAELEKIIGNMGGDGLGEFSITFSKTSIIATAGETISVDYTITGADENTMIKALSQNGWSVKVAKDNESSGTISITAPDPLVEDEIIVLVYDGGTRTIMSTIDCVKGVISPSSEVKEVANEGGSIEMPVRTNVEYTVSIQKEAEAWLSYISTKTMRDETLTFSCTANGDKSRTGIVYFLNSANDTISSFTVLQLGRGMDLEVTTTAAGTLETLVNTEQASSYRTAKISGPLNSKDIITINSMTDLDILDLEDASIVRGGGRYDDTYGTENNVIGNNMFAKLSLSGVVFPSTATEIRGPLPESLEEVTLPKNLVKIGDNAFSWSKIQSIEIPEGTEEIGRSAFYQCRKLTSVQLPKTLKYIRYQAFIDCDALKSINLPESLLVIETEAFWNCRKMEGIALPANLQELGDGAFRECGSITEIEIPKKITSIGANTFTACSSLVSVKMHDDIIAIGGHAFRDCNKLQNVNLSERLMIIGTRAFENCYCLATIALSPYIYDIGDRAFDNGATINYDISYIELKANPEAITSIGENIFSQDMYDNITLYVPTGTKDKYLTTAFGLFQNIEEKDFGDALGVNLPNVEMVEVTGGTFQRNGYSITVSDFSIGKYEVTMDLWFAVMGYNAREYSIADKYPVSSIEYDECVLFASRLSALTNKNYRLPTEAEWEFAARGGNQSHGYQFSGSNDIDEVAWHEGNSGGTFHEVGGKNPNELGIYDMTGNVEEWCHDWYDELPNKNLTDPTGPDTPTNSHVIRGGSFNDNENYSNQNLSVNARTGYTQDFTSGDIGFRLVLVN